MLIVLWPIFIDIVNCENDDGCHDNATCIDGNGSYMCVCRNGFTGDGFNCTGNGQWCHFYNPDVQILDRSVLMRICSKCQTNTETWIMIISPSSLYVIVQKFSLAPKDI